MVTRLHWVDFTNRMYQDTVSQPSGCWESILYLAGKAGGASNSIKRSQIHWELASDHQLMYVTPLDTSILKGSETDSQA